MLNFDESDSDDEEEDEKETGVHELPGQLEVASDESDFEDEGSKLSKPKNNKKVNQVQIDAWIDALKQQPSIRIIQDIIEAFRGAAGLYCNQLPSLK